MAHHVPPSKGPPDQYQTPHHQPPEHHTPGRPRLNTEHNDPPTPRTTELRQPHEQLGGDKEEGREIHPPNPLRDTPQRTRRKRPTHPDQQQPHPAHTTGNLLCRRTAMHSMLWLHPPPQKPVIPQT